MFKRLIMIKWIFLAFYSSFMLANNKIIIQGKFLDIEEHEIHFLKLEQFEIGSKIIATTTLENESFKFELPSNTQPGVYRLKYSPTNPNKYFDIIINGMETLIEVTYKCNQPNTLPNFNLQSENYIYYSYLEHQTKYLEILSISQYFLQNYPNPKETIYKQVLKNYYSQCEKIKKIEKEYLKKNEKYFWATSLIKNKPIYFQNNFTNNELIETEKYQNYWNFIDVSNSKLLNTPLFSDHILMYLQYHLNSNLKLSNEEIEIGLKQSVDKILMHFSSNEAAQKFAILYLLKGFQEIGFNQIVTYIDNKYQNLVLKYSSQNEIETYLNRKETYEKLKPGTLAPKIEWKGINKDEKSGLHQIKAKEIVVVFWSSECPHCEETMKKLDNWAINNKDKAVIAIGIETEKEKYFESIKKYKNIQFYTDFKGFESIPVKEYAVNATPTFYLIDENKLIIKSYDYYPFN